MYDAESSPLLEAPDGSSFAEAYPAQQAYAPTTPFLETFVFTGESEAPATTSVETMTFETPFVSEYHGEDPSATATAAGSFREVLAELYDLEFDEALMELAQEAAAIHAEQGVGLLAGEAQHQAADQVLEHWLEPLRAEAEGLVDTMAEALAQQDVAALGEDQVDAVLDRFQPEASGGRPAFEQFLGALWNKAKAVAKTAINTVKSVAGTVMKALPLPVKAILEKLKGLVRPMLSRVLRFAIGRLPGPLQATASTLAKRLLGDEGGRAKTDAEQPATASVTEIQRQLDVEIASLLFAADEAEADLVAAEATTGSMHIADPVRELEQARGRFVDRLSTAAPRQHMGPELEEFLPVIMAALPAIKIGIGIIGRQNVVNTLAKLVAKLIERYVGQPAATELSRAIVDTGLGLLTLEAAEQEPRRLAGTAIAATIEDTVRKVGEEGQHVFEDQILLEAATLGAFQEAVAANFPPALVRPNLREAATTNGMWVLRPRPAFKKYTRVMETAITPQIAAQIKTFGGQTLASFLKTRYGQDAVRSRVHLYEAIPGTTLGRIAAHQPRLPGLGRHPRGWSLFHPLTPEAAGLLLREPGLGSSTGTAMPTRGQLTVGQRVYYLELAVPQKAAPRGVPSRTPAPRPSGAGNGYAPTPTPTPTPAPVPVPAPIPGGRASEINVTLDFKRTELRVHVFLSEAEAQTIAGRLRSGASTASVILLVSATTNAGLRTALGGEASRHVRIVEETVESEEFLGKALGYIGKMLLEKLAEKAKEWLARALAQYFEARKQEFIAAADAPGDGVTIIVTLREPPGMNVVRAAIRGEALKAGMELIRAFVGEPSSQLVRTVPGFVND